MCPSVHSSRLVSYVVWCNSSFYFILFLIFLKHLALFSRQGSTESCNNAEEEEMKGRKGTCPLSLSQHAAFQF